MVHYQSHGIILGPLARVRKPLGPRRACNRGKPHDRMSSEVSEMPLRNVRIFRLQSDIRWYVRMLLSEARSFPHHIRMLSQRRRRRPDPIDLGPLYEQGPGGELLPCKATIARTRYVEFLLARYPWVSDSDIVLALDGWDKGTECSRHSEGTNKMENIGTRDQYPLVLTNQGD